MDSGSQEIGELFARLCAQRAQRFAQDRQGLGAPREQGVYTIRREETALNTGKGSAR